MALSSNPLPNCEQFIIGSLRNDAGVIAAFAALGIESITSPQVYSVQAPQGKGYPYLIVQFYSSTGQLALGESDFSFENPVYLVKAVTQEEDYTNAHLLMRAAEDALKYQSMVVVTFGGVPVTIQGVRVQPPRIEMIEIETDGVRINHVGARFNLFVSAG